MREKKGREEGRKEERQKGEEGKKERRKEVEGSRHVAFSKAVAVAVGTQAGLGSSVFAVKVSLAGGRLQPLKIFTGP